MANPTCLKVEKNHLFSFFLGHLQDKANAGSQSGNLDNACRRKPGLFSDPVHDVDDGFIVDRERRSTADEEEKLLDASAGGELIGGDVLVHQDPVHVIDDRLAELRVIKTSKKVEIECLRGGAILDPGVAPLSFLAAYILLPSSWLVEEGTLNTLQM